MLLVSNKSFVRPQPCQDHQTLGYAPANLWWHHFTGKRKLFVFLLSFNLLSGCTTSVKERSFAEYLSISGPDSFDAVDSDPRLQGMVNILSNFDTEVIRNTLDDVYGEPLYFNDTFHTFRSREALKNYFLRLSETAKTNVTFLDVQSAGDDVLVRWSMTIRFSVWWKDIDVNSIGISHVRFDENDKIIMHQDYWDGVEGFYAHLPLVGSLLKSIRARLGEG